jgi:6-phosphogluconolactonase/glucosamine-6-phosphate isomerase/deaminase
MSKLGFGDSSADRDTAASASKDKVPSTLEHRESPADRWADELADWIAKRLCHIVDRQGQALLYVSGGSSPVPVFKRLSQLAVPWAQVTITLVDERVVPDAHPASNARLVQEHLLVGNAQWARWNAWRRQNTSSDRCSDSGGQT